MFKYTFPLLLLFIGLSAHTNDIEQRFIQAGLVDVQTIDPSIRVDLVNSAPENNYFRRDFYARLNKAYVQKAVAKKLARAQRYLKAKYPTYSLHIMDAARPRSVSQQMYDIMKGTRFARYVANPKTGSMHNYGIAVDITIVDANGQLLDMGFSPFYKSNAELLWIMAQKQIGASLSAHQRKNRRLLATVMKQAGFIPLSFEWWHFNGMAKSKARRHYRIIE
jgi:zinc D-Ala-D-Ala dipeptidase